MLLAPAPAAGQEPAPGPPGPYVVDLRGVTIALPEAAGPFPPLSAGTAVPARGLGFDVGAHLYFLGIGPARLGVGAALVQARGSEPAPGLETTLRSIVPQLSFNFGSAEGWSYLSVGAGTSDLTVRARDGVTAERQHDGITTINAGGGARWFLGDRLAFGFDLRLYRLAATETLPRTMLFAAAAGVSLR